MAASGFLQDCISALPASNIQKATAIIFFMPAKYSNILKNKKPTENILSGLFQL
jgi:hypothetical protein